VSNVALYDKITYTDFMTFLLSVLGFGLCIFFMAIGLIFSKKILKKGCSLGPDCTCKNEESTKLEDCENYIK